MNGFKHAINRQRLCMHIPIPIIQYLYHILLRPDMIDSEIISNRCNHIWLCNRSLDGNTLQNYKMPDIHVT